MAFELKDLVDAAQVASAAFTGWAAYYAGRAVRVPWQNQHDQKLLEEAILSLDRAFTVLTAGDDPAQPLKHLPERSRRNWLSCADHVQRFKSLKAKITVELYIDLCKGHERFWRDRFHRRITGAPEVYSYYYDNLDTKSVLTVYAFIFLPDNDPGTAIDFDPSEVVRHMPHYVAEPLRQHLRGKQRPHL